MRLSIRTRLVLHVVVAAIGVALIVGGFVAVAHPRVTCRGEIMNAGDVCHHMSMTGDLDKTQTYEERLQAARTSQPVVIGLGVLVTGFGGFLLVSDLRRREQR